MHCLSFFPVDKHLQKIAPVAQLDRASVCGTEGHRFDSYRVHHYISDLPNYHTQ
jgi:hypothetical protein